MCLDLMGTGIFVNAPLDIRELLYFRSSNPSELWKVYLKISIGSLMTRFLILGKIGWWFIKNMILPMSAQHDENKI